MNKKFVHEFYKLFFTSENEYYIGSKEQARLMLQLKFGKYIPMSLINRAFKAFELSGLIVNTKTKEKIEMKIGIKVFNAYPQKVYRRLEVNNPEKVLESLYVLFQDIETLVDEPVTDSDIKELRDLESEKGISIKELLNEYDYRYADFSDVGLLYDIPRTTIKEFIKTLEKYDRDLEDKKEQEKHKEREEYWEKEREIEVERGRIMQNIIKECFDLLKLNLEIEGVLKITISSYFDDEYNWGKCGYSCGKPNSVEFGWAYAKYLTFNDNKINVIQDNIDFTFEIHKAIVYASKQSISLIGDGVKLTIHINKGLDALRRLSPYC